MKVAGRADGCGRLWGGNGSGPPEAGRVQTRRALGAVSAAAHAPEASLLVEAGLLAFGSEEAAVPQLAEDSRALHRGLEPLQKTLAVFTVSKRYIRQRKASPFSPGEAFRPSDVSPKYTIRGAEATTAARTARAGP